MLRSIRIEHSRGLKHSPMRMMWASIVAGCVATAATCGYDYSRARLLKDAIVPPGDAVPAFATTSAQKDSVLFTWEFDSHLAETQYRDWVVNRLRERTFQMIRLQSSLVASRQDAGDSYRLELQLSSNGSMTHVRASLVVSPD